MASKNVTNFVATYGPVAQQVSKEINVDPNVLLGQWGMESRWGQTEMAKKYHNLGGIKDFTGKGFEAKDNKTGSLDKYAKFEDPEVFGMYYADMIKNNFPKALNTGPDVGAFTRGLQSGVKGSYFDVSVPQEEYEKSLTGALNAIPEDQQLPFTPTAKPETVNGPEGDMVLVPAPLAKAPPPPNTDKSGASKGERFLMGGAGTAIGTAAAMGQAYADMRNANAARSAGLPGNTVTSGGVTQPTQAGPLSGGQTSNAQSTRILQGTLGDEGTTGRARMTGFNTETSQASARQKEMSRLLEELQRSGVVADDAQSFFAKQPGMTSSPSGILYPRSDAPTVGLGPRGPEGQIGYTRPPPPAPPSLAARTMTRAGAGLDYVTDIFKGMMRPVAGAASTVGKYALPPLAGLSAGLDAAEIAHEYDKPEDQRDYAKMALKGASLVGGALSMYPPAAVVGIPLSLGASAIQGYRDDPEYYNNKLREYVTDRDSVARARQRNPGGPMR